MIPDSDLDIYTKYFIMSIEDFGMYFENLDKMHISNWTVTILNSELENESNLQDKLVELFMSPKLNHWSCIKLWINVNTIKKYLKLCAKVNPFLFAISSSCLIEAVFSHIYSLLTKQRNIKVFN